ncbi:hypothetical protein [Streptomyces sp. NPDC047928]
MEIRRATAVAGLMAAEHPYDGPPRPGTVRPAPATRATSRHPVLGWEL